MQMRLHDQVFGDSPVDNVLAGVKDKLPAVAEAARVDVIASGELYPAPGVQIVTKDVTDELVRVLVPQPDEKLLKRMEPKSDDAAENPKKENRRKKKAN
jgi:hypothetical protein